MWKISKQFCTFALAHGYQWGWMVAVYSKILALVRVFLFNQGLPETDRAGRQSCLEVWHDLHRRREFAGTLRLEHMYIHTHK